MQVVITRSRIHLSSVWCLPISPCEYAACEAYWILLCCFLKLAMGCFDSGTLWRNSGSGQCQRLSVTDPEQPAWSCQLSTACGSLCCEKDQAAHQSLLLLALGPGVGQQKSQNTQRSTFTYRLSVWLSHLERLRIYFSVGNKLHTVGLEGFQWVGPLLLPRLMLHGGECSACERRLLQYGG